MNISGVMIGIGLIVLVGAAIWLWSVANRRRVDKLSARQDTRPPIGTKGGGGGPSEPL